MGNRAMAFTDVMLLWGHEADVAGWAPKQGTRRAEWGVVRVDPVVRSSCRDEGSHELSLDGAGQAERLGASVGSTQELLN